MKHRISLLLLLLLLPVQLFSKTRDELIPDYEIMKNEKDDALQNNEAVFIFTFTTIPVSAKIKASCNGKEKEITTTSEGKYTLKIKPGKYKFQLFYNNDYYEIYTDSIKIQPGYRIEINVYFQSSLYPVIMDKPVIYCYPREKTNIHIDLQLKGNMLFTYPLYNKGWDFTAEPNGTIHANGNEFKYLFWEGETQINYATTDWGKGAIVPTEDLLSYLETSLDQMGMTGFEKQDFITYWYPLMCKNSSNYIHFVFNENYNEYAGMNISPKPDNMLRVYMLWTDATGVKEVHLEKQEIPTLKREGFTLVEWGGSEMQEMPSLDL